MSREVTKRVHCRIENGFVEPKLMTVGSGWDTGVLRERCVHRVPGKRAYWNGISARLDLIMIYLDAVKGFLILFPHRKNMR